jgi:hypothetical protein
VKPVAELGGGREDKQAVAAPRGAEVVLDAGDQVGNAGEAAASDVLVGEFAEPVISQTAVAI